MSLRQPEGNFDLNFNMEELDGDISDEELLEAAMALEQQFASASVTSNSDSVSIETPSDTGARSTRFPELPKETVEQLAAKKTNQIQMRRPNGE